MNFLDDRLPSRFWDQVVPEPNSGCWLWAGPLNDGGYGRYTVASRTRQRVHRVAYEAAHGPIGVGLELDHLCRTRSCCNPAHLEAVTHAENVRRGEAGMISGAQRLAKTHCPHGHPYDETNTLRTARQRACRACKVARTRAWRASKKAAGSTSSPRELFLSSATK